MHYKFLMQNIYGANTPPNRKDFIIWKKKLKHDIICLQETHIRKKDVKCFIYRTSGEEFILASLKKAK